MSKNIFEELPSRKGTSAEARPQLKGGSAERGGSTMGASDVEQGADPKAKAEKRVRQAVYDIRYRARREDVPLGQALSQYMQNSKLTPQEQAAVKSQLKEEYEVADMISDATANALYRVFVMNETTSEQIDPSQEYLEELNQTKDRKYHVRVTDKNTGKTYYRYATREKVNQLRANPNIRSVEMLDKMDPTYGKKPYEGERKRGEQTAAVASGKGLDAVGKEDKDIDNDGDHDKNDKYLLNRRKVRGSAIATRKEDFIWSEETTSTEGQNKKKLTGKGVDNYSTGVVKVSPDENSAVKKEEYSSGLRRFHSALQFEATMTSAEKKEEKKLKNKYDKSGMKDSMKKQYGEKGKNIYFATIRKKAMQNAHYEFEDGTLLDEMGMPILGVVKKDSAKKEGPSCDTNSDDMRSLPTKVNLIKNKMRAMGLKMSYEPEGKQIDEIAPLVAAGLAAGAALAGGAVIKRSQDAAKSGVDAAKKGQKIKPGIGIGNAAYGMQKHNDALKDVMKQYNSYESEGEMVDEARAIGRTRSTDANPRGAAVRLSSGRGSTMTPARGLGASKPEGDDEERSSRQKEQAKKDRRAAAIDRAEEGEDRLSRLVRSVQNSSYEPEGEVLEDYVVVKKDGSRQIVKGDPPTPKVKPSPYNRALAKKQKKEASRNRDENPYIARPGESD